MEIVNGVLKNIALEDIENGTFKKWEGVEEIGEYAFSGWKKLKKIEIPNSVKKINPFAFEHCINLKKIVLNSSIEIVPSHAFYNCTSLKEIIIPKTVKKIDHDAFGMCSNLKTVIFHSKQIKEIGSRAFCDCSSLKSIDMPDSVESIGYSCFEKCSSLKKIKLSKNLKEISDEMFSECLSLKKIKMPANLEAIETYAFYNCKNLKEVILNEKIEEIGQLAFFNCYSLKSIYLPESISFIKKGAFKFCYKLNDVKIPSEVREIEDETFYNCKSLSNIFLSKNINTIGANAFRMCSSLEKIEIPNSVKKIEKGCFSNCGKLETVDILADIEKIPQSCFEECIKLKKIRIPSTVKIIDSYAFSQCYQLSNINIPDSVEKINDGAFRWGNFDSIKLPKNLKFLSRKVFENCENLRFIELENKDFEMDNYSFYNTQNLELVKIEEDIYDIGEYSVVLLDSINQSTDFIWLLKQDIKDLKMLKLIKYPCGFLKKLTHVQLEKIMKKENIKHFKKIYDEYFFNKKISEENLTGMYTFAYNLGCFANETAKINGKEMNVSQKASVFLKQVLDEELLEIDEAEFLFEKLNINEYDAEFLSYVTQKEKKGNEENYYNFIHMCDKGILMSRIINDFKKIKKEVVLDKKGRIIKDAPVRKKIENYLVSRIYENVEENNQDLVEELVKFADIFQEDFDYAQYLRKISVGIPSHILEEPLKEETRKSINLLKKQIEKESIDTKKILDELYDKEFTYEWLDKHDPKNFTIGLYCDCCATIVSDFYGKEIVRDSVIRDDVQNLIIRDKHDEIIAKAVIYVNREKGYAVFNDIEMSVQFNDREGSKHIEERKKILEAFKRGIEAFVKKYNNKNENKPITQVNIGMGYNSLKDLIKKHEKRSNEMFDVPDSFQDAREEQWIIYKKRN